MNPKGRANPTKFGVNRGNYVSFFVITKKQLQKTILAQKTSKHFQLPQMLFNSFAN
jgi:hypothetical protein